MNRRTAVYALLAVVIFLVGLWLGQQRAPHEPAKAISAQASSSLLLVDTLRVAATEVRRNLEVTGTVASSLTASVAPKIMGKVVAVGAREGDRVRAGQVLVQLDAADLAAQVRQAEAAVAAARAAMTQARTGLGLQRAQSSTEVEQARSALRQAQEQLSLIKEGARRQQKLQTEEGVRQAQAGVIQAQEGVQAAQAERRQAQQGVQAAQAQKLQAEEGVRQAQAQKAQAEEGVRQAQAALAAAREQLSLVKEGARRQQKAQAEAGLRQAEANLRVAQATYDRFKPLAEQGVISAQRFDEIQLQLDVARSQYETAQQQTDLVLEGARTQEVRQAEEGVRQAEAALGIARQQVTQAEAGIRAAQQQVAQAEAGLGGAQERVAQAESGVQVASQRVAQAEAAVRIAEQQRDLTYEGARAQEVRQAEEAVKQAQENLRLALAGTDQIKIKADQVKMLEAQVRQAEANAAAARVQLGYATVVAPFSGIVVERHVDPGDMAAPGMPLITLVDPEGYRLEVQVPESQMQGVQLGGEAEVNLEALRQTMTGRIAQIVPAADPASRTFVVKIGLPKVPGLKSGLFGRARLPVALESKLLIPAGATWRQGSLTGVIEVREGVAHRRLVTLGRAADGQVEVLSGLRGGEIIVAQDAQRIPDGTRVSLGGGVR